MLPVMVHSHQPSVKERRRSVNEMDMQGQKKERKGNRAMKDKVPLQSDLRLSIRQRRSWRKE